MAEARDSLRFERSVVQGMSRREGKKNLAVVGKRKHLKYRRWAAEGRRVTGQRQPKLRKNTHTPHATAKNAPHCHRNADSLECRLNTTFGCSKTASRRLQTSLTYTAAARGRSQAADARSERYRFAAACLDLIIDTDGCIDTSKFVSNLIKGDAPDPEAQATSLLDANHRWRGKGDCSNRTSDSSLTI